MDVDLISKNNDGMNFLIDEKNLRIGPKIGYGFSGRIYRGKLLSKKDHHNIIRTIAVKEIDLKYNEKTEDVNKKIREEIKFYIKLQHSNVISILGICERSNRVSLIIMEYAFGGCLFNYLINSKLEIPFVVFLNWSLQIATGMEYIHSNNFIHCDLKARNVLLSIFPKNIDQMLINKLKISNISHFSRTGTPSHMAPEFMKNKPSKKSDVWSFGVVLWEILHRKAAYEDLEPLQILFKIGIKKEIFEIREDVNPMICKLIKSCLSFDENDRPDFSQIRSLLTRMEKLNK